MNGQFPIPEPVNEPVRGCAPGSVERLELKAALADWRGRDVEIPLRIGGKAVRTGRFGDCTLPHEHGRRIGRYHKAGSKEVRQAIEAAIKARRGWAAMPFHARAAVFLKAAELLAGPWRARINAASMLDQGKNAFQAEVDAACELIDFWRFNAKFAEQLYRLQPMSVRGTWNYVDHRPLEGFVFAVTPFNFASIAGNLPTSPALMGNVCVWKPASSTVYVAHHLMELLREAGLPDGVINLVAGSGGEVGDPVLAHRALAGVHFTGSTEVFQGMWSRIGANIKNYAGYPRIVGETGGKDFIVAHPSADPDALLTALLRGAYEYQGQKCSAVSRAYIPRSLWAKLKQRLGEELEGMTMGPPEDFRNFFNAVIDRAAFKRIQGFLDRVKKSRDAKVLFGGRCDDSTGWFVEPTVVESSTPDSLTMREEIFGPVLSLYVYPDGKWRETLRLCDRTSPYALTGAVFAADRGAILEAMGELSHAAGNFYINDKPTGAVVGQQPFGGARASGTNDKAGSLLNLMRWVSPRSVKESFVPPTDYRYPFMSEE